MEFPKSMIKGPKSSGLYEKREKLIKEINVNPSCGLAYKIKQVTKELCAATGVPYPKREFRI